MQAVSPNDFSNEGFPFAHSQEIEIAYAHARANRITYVGELGWELYIPTEFASGVYDSIVAAGHAFELAHCGYHALNSLRIEKAYRHWGHDITIEETPIEAGLMPFVKMNKSADFIGRKALSESINQTATRTLVQFLLDDNEAMLYHNEPIWCDAELVGYICSGMYGHTLGAAVGLGYVKRAAGIDAAFIESGRYEIEVAGRKILATASLQPLYDPNGERVRS